MQPELNGNSADAFLHKRLLAAHERALETARESFKAELNVLGNGALSLVHGSGDDLKVVNPTDASGSDSKLCSTFNGRSALKSPSRASSENKVFIVDGDAQQIPILPDDLDAHLLDDRLHDDPPPLAIPSSKISMLQSTDHLSLQVDGSKAEDEDGCCGKHSSDSVDSTPWRGSRDRMECISSQVASYKDSMVSLGLNTDMSVREEWQHHLQQEESKEVLMVVRIHKSSEGAKKRSTQRVSIQDLVRQIKRHKKFKMSDLIAAPGANWRLAWDLAGALLIGYDTVAIPFGLAFQPEENVFTVLMDWITMIFWTIDMVLTFFVGFISQGVTVMSPTLIAKRYLTTWFLLDAIVVAGDWFNNVGNASSSGTNVSGLGRLVRSLRAIRILRLLRLLKLKRMLAELQDHINSEYTYLLLALTKLLFFILLLNHGISCIWWWLGRTCYSKGMPSWVATNVMWERELGYQYTTSMHWTLTQFTPASMEVVPQNTEERTLCVFVLMFALVAFSSFVGSISTSMTALRNMNADTNKQFWMLRRYFKQANVAKPVARRIVKYLEYIVENKAGKVQYGNIKILSMLSEQLREELTYELTRPNLQKNQFFQWSSTLPFMEPMLRRICTVALFSKTYARQDVIFYSGDDAKHIYCLLHGNLGYIHAATMTTAITSTQCLDESAELPMLEPPVQDLEWVSEAALWSPWKHMGMLRALQECEIMVLDIAKFIEECGRSIKSWALASHFGKLFVALAKGLELTDVIRDEAFCIALEQQINEGLRVGPFLPTAVPAEETDRDSRSSDRPIMDRSQTTASMFG